MKRTVVSLFENLEDAERAIKRIDPQLAYAHISIVVKNKPQHQDLEASMSPYETRLHSMNGVLVQSPVIDVPELGKVAAAGPLAGALMQDDKGLSDSLIYYGIGAHAAQDYQDKVRQGHTLVVIESDSAKTNEIANLLLHHGAYEAKKWSATIDHPLYPHG